jgi:hypothetical protein
MSERTNLRLWSCCIIVTTKAYDNKEFAAWLRERTNNKMELQHWGLSTQQWLVLSYSLRTVEFLWILDEGEKYFGGEERAHKKLEALSSAILQECPVGLFWSLDRRSRFWQTGLCIFVFVFLLNVAIVQVSVIKKRAQKNRMNDAKCLKSPGKVLIDPSGR